MHNPLKRRVVIGYPPSANVLWRTMRGRVVKAPQARVYSDTVRLKWLSAGLPRAPLTGDVAVRLEVFRPQRSGDLDNRLKAVFDALNGLAWSDDSQVAHLEATRREAEHANEARVIVEVWPIEGGVA